MLMSVTRNAIQSLENKVDIYISNRGPFRRAPYLKGEIEYVSLFSHSNYNAFKHPDSL